MSPEQQALFEAASLIAAHARLLANVAENWASPGDLLSQIERVKSATDAYAKLPRPQQKAA
jgi:hypothetical protein